MRILFTGFCRPGNTTYSRLVALKELGHEVYCLDQALYFDRYLKIVQKIQHHLLAGPGIGELNRAVVALARECKPDIIFFDMGLLLWRDTIEKLKTTGALLVHYTSEFFGFRSYLYRHFLRSIALYHVHVITNELILPKLRENGAKKVVLTEFGYDPVYQCPDQGSQEVEKDYRSDAVFIGHWEPTTQRNIEGLINAKVDVSVWGSHWRWRALKMKGNHMIRPIEREDYPKMIASSKIGLGFLSKWNKNQSAGRIFEIPALGSFLLAERTQQNTSYFKEGVEADFFSSREELIEKAKYYLEHDDQRIAMAQAGHKRCMASPYRIKDRVEKMMTDIE